MTQPSKEWQRTAENAERLYTALRNCQKRLYTGPQPTHQERTMTTAREHQHKAVRERGPYPFIGPVAGDGGAPGDPAPEYWPPAHGNVMMIEVCSCGWERRYLVNGKHYEYGRWARSAEQMEADRKRAYDEAVRQNRLRRANRMLARARKGVDGVRFLDVAPGIQIDFGRLSAEELARDDAEVEVVAMGQRSRAKLGDLRRAGREWRGDESPAGQVYTAIARVLP